MSKAANLLGRVLMLEYFSHQSDAFRKIITPKLVEAISFLLDAEDEPHREMLRREARLVQRGTAAVHPIPRAPPFLVAWL